MSHTPKIPFRPFADEVSVQTFGDFSFENGTTRIALHGSVDVTRDRAGLERARALRQVLDAIVRQLEAEDLPQAVAETVQAPTIVKNPFA
ncbi:hypothetical protein [Methylobacterium gnaphalii]|uniref:Uncharacterized protein n=1 Tax=Methylobacterium gnaphalii TaxID=1010610 RepID=A0A512JRU6_9HYPH|nr:hypothetical protein [Methylobacterium gnaphalii]GEP12678.1 hypothetical protein MGN01_45230 [Methylobacterium gnaphalii]GJD70856.1 hypothetical protein MMMDOFMJ_3809 [Methylobacterium gnaphalii]GLS51701.1 hypothetical protein GCM10007885_45620 [Methylobacterium gnaphalii]